VLILLLVRVTRLLEHILFAIPNAGIRIGFFVLNPHSKATELGDAEITIHEIENIDPHQYQSLLTTGLGQPRMQTDDEAEPFRRVYVRLLLLRIRVHWRGKVADLRN
jgi:hypothetical protein